MRLAALAGATLLLTAQPRTENTTLTAVDGIRVGHFTLAGRPTGCTVILAPDAPDLPALLIGKLFRALGSAPVSVCPEVSGNGLVALAARFPLPAWLADVTLDTPDALARLAAQLRPPG